MAAEKGIHQRVRQTDDLDEGYQTGPFDLPEWRLGKTFAPEDLPAGDGSAVSAESLGQLTDAAWRRSLAHGTDQDDDDAEIDLWAEEAHRRWRGSLPAAIAVAAKAQPQALLLG